MASLSTCHLGLWLGWQILLNLVNQVYRPVTDIVCIKIETLVADRYTTINHERHHSDYLQ